MNTTITIMLVIFFVLLLVGVPVAFSMEERTPMRSRNAPEFKDYFNLIWKELNISG